MIFADIMKVKLYDLYHEISGMRAQSGEVGIEIELEGENLPHGGIACKGWDIHPDNSLRGPGGRGAGGAEYTTRGAIMIKDVHTAVSAVRRTLENAKVVLREDSPRTSTHIHLNVQQMSLSDVFGYITIFSAIEPLFLNLCGPRRDGNSFCAPGFDSGDLPDFFHSTFSRLEKYSSDNRYVELPGRGKYASLGTFRLHDLGTLEARAFPSSIDPDTIQKWCLWLNNIKTLVEKQEDKTFRSLIKTGLQDPMYLVTNIFGYDHGLSNYLASELVEYGSREAYELTRLIKFFMNKKETPKKQKKTLDIMEDFVEMVDIPEPRANPAAARPRRWEA